MEPENKNSDSLSKNVDSIKQGNAGVPPDDNSASPISSLGDNLQIINDEPEAIEMPTSAVPAEAAEISSIASEMPASSPDINTEAMPTQNSIDTSIGQAVAGPSTDSISASPQSTSETSIPQVTTPQTPATPSSDWGSASQTPQSGGFFGGQTKTDEIVDMPPKKSGKKKLLIMMAVLLILLPGAGFAAFLGYNKYLAPTPKKVLNAAAKTMQEMSPFTSDITVDVSTTGLKYSITGVLSVDKNKSFDLKLVVPPSTSLNMFYLNKEDKFYLSDFTNLESKNNLIEYSNLKKYLAKYEKEMGQVLKTPTSLEFTDEDLKYVKKEKSEVLAGVKTTKYSFNPTKEYIEKNMPAKDLGIEVDKIKMTLNFWVGNKDSKLYKLDMNLKMDMSASALGSVVKGAPSEFEIGFTETFKYDFNGTIAMPTDAKIMQKVDLSAEDPFAALTGGSVSPTSASDKQVMNALRQIAIGEADFYDENETYSDADGTSVSTLDLLIKEIAAAGSATPARDIIQLSLDAKGYTASAQLVSDTTRYFCVDATDFADYVETAPMGELCSPE